MDKSSLSKVGVGPLTRRQEIDRDEKEIKDSKAWHQYKTVGKGCMVIIFYVISCIFYSREEHWSIVNSVYFVTVTITTVGFGDYEPTKDRTRLFTIFVIVVGLIFILSCINDFASYIMAKAEASALHFADKNHFNMTDLGNNKKYMIRRANCVAGIMMVVLTCSIFMMIVEDWSFVKSLYFSVVTTTTVGYGTMDINTEESTLFLILYIPISVVCVASAMGELAKIEIDQIAEENRVVLLSRKLDYEMLRELDQNGQGVNLNTFVLAMLEQTGKINKHRDIAEWVNRFRVLDADGNGKLDQEDITLLVNEENERIAAITHQRAQQLLHSASAKIRTFPLSRESSKCTNKDLVGQQFNGVNV